VRDKGNIRGGEFYALSEHSRRAVMEYLPDQAPRSMGVKGEEARKRRDIDEELRRITSRYTDLQTRYSDIERQITELRKKGGDLDPTPASPGRPVQQAAETRDKSPVVNVSVGAVDVRIAVADELEQFMRNYVETRLKTEIGKLNRMSGAPIPTAQGAVE